MTGHAAGRFAKTLRPRASRPARDNVSGDASRAARDGGSGTDRRFAGYLARFRKQVILALVLGLAASSCAALLMFASGYLISKTARPEITLFSILVPVALVQLFGVGRPLARYLERLVSHDWVFRITSDLRRRLFGTAASNASDPTRNRATGDYLNLLADDIGHLQNLYLRVAFPIAIALLLYIAASAFLGFLSPILALASALAGLVAVILIPIAALLATQAVQNEAKALRSREYASLTDDVLGAADWALANRSLETRQRHEANGSAFRMADRVARRRLHAIELASSLGLGITTCLLVALAAGALGTEQGQADCIAAVALGFFPLIEVFALMPAAMADAPVHREALARLDGAIGGEAEPQQDPDQGERGRAKTTASPDAPIIELKNASYSYPGARRPAISGITAIIPTGQKLAVIGASGSGKSTLAAILRGSLAPDAGSLHVGGSPFGKTGNEAALVGFIPQAPYLFDRSLRENLALGNPDASDGAIEEALDKVGLAGAVARLPHGLDTPIGETGMGLSGGEAHRVALARVLLSDAPIVILDEPFAALDPATESDLLSTLLDAFEGKTLIVITHHLLGIERFDRVILMDGGRIELDGNPCDLARTEPRFRELLEFDRGLTNQRGLGQWAS